MERLSGLDAAFLSMETPTMHMHMAAVLVFEPPEHQLHEPPAVHAERMRRVVGERLHLVPLLRRRAVTVPFGLNHPVWVDDPDFDLDYHLQRACLPAPGGPGELADFVAGVVSRPLDLQRPLWEIHVVEGLESGHLAVVVKLHHAGIDGVSGAEALAAFLDLTPEARVVDPPARPWRPDPIPGDFEVLGYSLTSLRRQPERAWGALRRTFGAFQDLSERNRRLREEKDVQPPPALFGAPRTSLNGAISSQRRTAFSEVPLEDMKTVCRAFGGTVNDVVLASVSGALRRLLAERGDTPHGSLVAMVPISWRSVWPGSSTEASRCVTTPISLSPSVMA